MESPFFLKTSNNLTKDNVCLFINFYLNHPKFTEDLILNNINLFNKYLIKIVRHSNNLSNNFLEKISNKNNYKKIIQQRKRKEPKRDFYFIIEKYENK